MVFLDIISEIRGGNKWYFLVDCISFVNVLIYVLLLYLFLICVVSLANIFRDLKHDFLSY
jgi:hypothetical protein